MLVDLHAHYPMHLIPPEQADTKSAILAQRPNARWKAILVDLLSRRLNYQGPKGAPSVTVELMRAGGVGAVLSVLYSPLDEMDLDLPYGLPPKPGYVKSLLDQIALVEDHVRAEPLGATVAHDAAALDAGAGIARRVRAHAREDDPQQLAADPEHRPERPAGERPPGDQEHRQGEPDHGARRGQGEQAPGHRARGRDRAVDHVLKSPL